MFTREKIIFLALGSFFSILVLWVIVSIVTTPPGSVDPYDEVPIPDVPREKPLPLSPPLPVGKEGIGSTVACTMDAKMCPDGSYVGRIAPNCEFAPCSSPSQNREGSCTSNSDCAKGYSCIDVSPVVREGTQNLRCWKDGMPTPICLSGETRIATPRGEVLVKNIREGDVVWSANEHNEKIAAAVLISSHTPAPQDHYVVHLTLLDGRELIASPGHKISDGRTLGSLSAGDRVDGSLVKSTTLISYSEAYTYDILPQSVSGKYWANGVLLQSTIKK